MNAAALAVAVGTLLAALATVYVGWRAVARRVLTWTVVSAAPLLRQPTSGAAGALAVVVDGQTMRDPHALTVQLRNSGWREIRQADYEQIEDGQAAIVVQVPAGRVIGVQAVLEPADGPPEQLDPRIDPTSAHPITGEPGGRAPGTTRILLPARLLNRGDSVTLTALTEGFPRNTAVHVRVAGGTVRQAQAPADTRPVVLAVLPLISGLAALAGYLAGSLGLTWLDSLPRTSSTATAVVVIVLFLMLIGVLGGIVAIVVWLLSRR